MAHRIALVAKRKSGKSTVAEMLVREHGYQRMSLAGPLKESAAVMLDYWTRDIQGEQLPITRDVIDRDKAVFRPLLEWLGTTFGREYLGTPERWIELFAASLPSDARVVCDDMRQPNEADALRAMGFVIVSVERNEAERMAGLKRCGEPTGVMASERHIEQISPDAWIRNYGSLDDLRAEVCALAQWARDEVAA